MLIKKFGYAIAGICYAVRYDRGFRTQVVIGTIGVGLVWYFGRPLSEFDVALLALATCLVLITELQNSAFEHALDRLHPGQDRQVGRSKDMAAGTVLMAALFAILVGAIILVF